MKIKLLPLIFCLCMSVFAKAQYVKFWDSNFKNWILANIPHTASPTDITLGEASAYTGGIMVSSLGIGDFTGIEYFTNIDSLDCSLNNLYTLNVSSNKALTYLNINGNNISQLSVSNNTLLTCLICDNNKYLTSIDLSKNKVLSYFDCRYSGLTSLDLSKNPLLEYLYCSNTPLLSINIQNGNNTHLAFLFAINDPNLFCVVVDNVAYATANLASNVASTSIFTTSMFVYIPDIKFKTWILNNIGHVSTPNNITQYEASLYKGDILVSNLHILDITGIEDFTGIVKLDCSYNYISRINLSNNIQLQYLNCSYNYGFNHILTNNNTALTYLDCSYTELIDVDISSNTLLTYFNISNSNSINSFDLSNNKALTQLICSNCSSLSTLDVSNNTSLQHLELANTKITTINLINDTLLTYLDCSRSQLSSLNLSKNTYLDTLLCSFCTNLTSLDLTKNSSLNSIECNGSALYQLNLQNGNNSKINDFIATNNRSLSCICVDNPTFFKNKWSFAIDTIALFSNNCSIYVTIPDSNFRDWILKNVPHTANAFNITYPEAAAYTGKITIASLSIASLKGIEAFININYIDVSNNQLTSLDLSKNTALTYMNCSNNQLTSLDLSKNTALTYINCSNNQLKSLDLSQNTSLSFLDCSNNLLTSLNVTNNTALTFLNCSGGKFFVLDLSKNSKLYYLDCSSGILPVLNISANTLLTYVDCSNNSIYKLDFSQNKVLNSLDCSRNANLWFLNVHNGINNQFVEFNATNDSSLSCINVDNVTYSNAYWINRKDAKASFSTSCSVNYVNIPDVHFKAWILANVPHPTNKNNITISEAAAFKGKINVPSLAIADLKGIETFASIDSMDCSNDSLTRLNLYGNPSLKYLNCSFNSIGAVDICNNPLITYLNCSYNYGPGFGIWGAVQKHFSLTLNNAITYLNCSNCYLDSFELLNNNTLTYLDCSGNRSSDLCSGNPHYCISSFLLRIIGISALTYLDCSNCSQRMSMNISGAIKLTHLNCSNSGLLSIDISKSTALTYLDCSKNFFSDIIWGYQISHLINLDVSYNLALTYLDCSLDSTFYTDTYYDLFLNKISSHFDVSKNKSLTYLNLKGYNADTINLQNGNNANMKVDASFNLNSHCFKVDDVANANSYVNSGKWDKDSSIAFSLNCGWTVPLKLNSLEANFTNAQSIALKWTSENENNTSLFIIEACTDGISFKEIGIVDAQGKGNNSYRFIDNKPANGFNYYRLRMIDNNGSATYSKVVSCECLLLSNQITLFPNPAKSSVIINGNHIAFLQVIDNIGRMNKVVSLKDATNPSLSLSGLPTGIYCIRIKTTEGKVSCLSIVKE